MSRTVQRATAGLAAALAAASLAGAGAGAPASPSVARRKQAFGVLMQAERSRRPSRSTILVAYRRVQKLKAWLPAH